MGSFSFERFGEKFDEIVKKRQSSVMPTILQTILNSGVKKEIFRETLQLKRLRCSLLDVIVIVIETGHLP